MPDNAALLERFRVRLAVNEASGTAWVVVRDPVHGDYRLVFPKRDARAIVAALQDVINANPEVFPLTDTRRVD